MTDGSGVGDTASEADSSGVVAKSPRKRICVAYRDDEVEEWPIDIAFLEQQRRAAARPRLQTSRFCFRRLRAAPWWSPQAAGVPIRELCASLEEHFEDILHEVQRTLRPLVGADDSESDDDDDDSATLCTLWSGQKEGLHTGVWLRCQVRHACNRAALPVLSALLDASHAVMLDPPGRAYISYMLAGDGASCNGTRVAPHAGPSNHRLRLHLPLVLPAGRPLGLTVGGEWRAWERGRCLLMDDSFEHSVNLNTRVDGGSRVGGIRRTDLNLEPCAELPRAQPCAEPGCRHRVVLVIDCWHPDAAWICPTSQRRAQSTTAKLDALAAQRHEP